MAGVGRTAADVQRELIAYRACVRSEHKPNTDTKYTPIFQGDYLFVKLGTAEPVKLARVVNDCYIDGARLPAIMFTIGLYEHTPQPGYSGFLGTFTKQENEAYDPADKKKGGKYMRIKNVSRDEVVCYNVGVWTDKELIAENARLLRKANDCLRITPSSLQNLAAILPEHKLPDNLPETHKHGETQSAKGEAADEDSVEDDDPPPPIPAGFEQTEWSEGTPIFHFMIWTSLGKEPTQWHHAVVSKELNQKRVKGYTHDANFTDGKRGVRLTKDGYEEGVWVPIRAVGSSSSSNDSISNPPSATLKSQPNRKARAQVVVDSSDDEDYKAQACTDDSSSKVERLGAQRKLRSHASKP